MIGKEARAAIGGVLVLVLGIVAGIWLAGGRTVQASRPILYTWDTLYSGQALGTSATITSTAYPLVESSEVQSVQYRATGGAVDVKFEVLTSIDGTTFALPDSGGTIKSSLTNTDWHHAALTVPVCKQVKVRVTNNSATVAATVSVFVAAQ